MTGQIGPRDMNRPRARRRISAELVTALVMLSPALLALTIFRILPLVSAIVGSVQHYRLNVVTVPFVGLENYLSVIASSDFLHALGVTLVFSLIVNPLQIGAALALAVLLSQPIRGAGIMRTLILLPIAVPPAVAALVWGYALLPDGAFNAALEGVGLPSQPFLTSESQALPAIILIASWIGIGFWTIILVAGLHDIPADYSEAAALDGAGWWKTFRHIILPLMRRPLAFVLVADTIANFLFFAPIQILTSGGPNGSTDVLMYEVYRQSYELLNPNVALPETVILMIVVFLVVAVEFRLLRSSD